MGSIGSFFSKNGRFIGYIKNGDGFLNAFIQVVILTFVVIAITGAVAETRELIGPALLFAGLICAVSIRPSGKDIKSIYPDMIFGFIDNSLLVISSLIGYEFFGGWFGALLGAAIGNSVSDAFGGLFEGMSAGWLKKRGIVSDRTPLTASIGKFAGCLIGAGTALTIYFVAVV